MLKASSALLLIFLLSACGMGSMKTTETYYLRVPGSAANAYMKVVVNSKSAVGKVELRQGWYPSNAVDALFGDVSSENSANALKTRDTIRQYYDEALQTAIQNYLNLATSATASSDELKNHLKAISRVRLIARDSIKEFDNSSVSNGVAVDVVEYNSAADVVQRRSGQKLVFVFSADPNSVINKIESFAASTKTQLEINKLIGAFSKREKNIVEAEVEKFNVSKKYDQLVTTQMDLVLEGLDDNTTREDALLKIDTLLALLQSIEGGK